MTTCPADIGIGALIAVVAVLGLVFNGCGLFLILKNSVLITTFGRLCLYLCIANIFVCTSFLLWISPMTIMFIFKFLPTKIFCFRQDVELSTGELGKVMGQMDAFFWNVSIYSHVILSIDRTIAVSIPVKTGLLLKYYRSWFLVAFPVLLALITVTPYFWYASCYYVYQPERWMWIYGETACGKGLNHYCLYKNTISVIIMATFDMITLYFLRKHHKFLRRNSVSSMNLNIAEIQRRQTEIRFFLQTVIQGGIFFVSSINHHALSHLNSSKLYTFVFTTFSWLVCHTVDGLVMCLFQMNNYESQRRTVTVMTAEKRPTIIYLKS